MDTADLVVVTLTYSSQDDAQEAAHALVEQRLCACAQVEAISSAYRWDGGVAMDDEWRVTGKTLGSRLPAIEEFLHGAHPYEVFQLVAVPVTFASPSYADWVRGSVSTPAAS